MTEDNHHQVSEQSSSSSGTTITKQRRKRKWDQPAESFISTGLEIPGAFPASNIQSVAGLVVPGIVSPTCTLTSLVSVTSGTISPTIQASSLQQTMATMLQKINPPKIQDELIAREIVINDAEPTVRYKLTKRQTQEEIQRCTGAVVITRGKYRPPNTLPDSDKPLYLHISAGSHLKETAERIIAVDRAAAMVEEMLNQGQNTNVASTPLYSAINIGGKVAQPLSVSVFLGFDTDPSLNLASRVRGPNDQYINHIMNETGVTVVLRGRDSGNFESINSEDIQQPLHLFLFGSNPKKLEDAKLLAENLLDTIAAECGASRISSSKVYKAVPPPPQLLAGVQSSGTDQRVTSAPVSAASPIVGSLPLTQISSAVLPDSFSQAALSQHDVFVSGHTQPNTICYPQTSVCGTSYSGYGGIYPQATPLQQVALVLRQTPSHGTSLSASAACTESTSANVMNSSTAVEKRPPQKRKFQELPKASKTPAKPHQSSRERSEFVKTGSSFNEFSARTTSSMPPPKMLVKPSSNGMAPPPPRSMPPPPSRTMPPPSSKLLSTLPSETDGVTSQPVVKSSSCPVPDTLIKLMEYGDEDDDDLDEVCDRTKDPVKPSKPFWAL